MSPTQSTRQQLVKVAQVPGLYRHSLSQRYYGIKKVSGKRKEHSLNTTDRKLAERRLKKWIADLGKTDAEMEATHAPGDDRQPQKAWRHVPTVAHHLGPIRQGMDGGNQGLDAQYIPAVK
jgi:hypothetical protein